MGPSGKMLPAALCEERMTNEEIRTELAAVRARSDMQDERIRTIENHVLSWWSSTW